jgi:hypothetical protein
MKAVRITVGVQVQDEKALEKHVRRLLVHEGVLDAVGREIVDETLGSYDDRTAGLVAEALVNCTPPPLDYGIEIQSIRAEGVRLKV